MEFEFRDIASDQIDSEDRTFQISTDPAAPELTDSIRTVGLLNRPVVVRRPDGGFRVVSGFRRVEACRQLGMDVIGVRITPPDIPERVCAQIAIAENASQRRLNLVEISRSARLLLRHVSDAAQISSILEHLGVSVSPAYLDKIHDLCQLPSLFQEGLIRETLALPVILEIGRMEDSESGLRLGQLLHFLHLSLNRQREIVTLVREIAAREGCAVSSVLEDGGLLSIAQDPDLDRGQKAREIRNRLRKRRFPTITAIECAYEQMVRELALGGDSQLLPPKNFEGQTFSFQFRFTRPEDLETACDILRGIRRHPLLPKILQKY